ncbi:MULTISPECIES: hypothetical protein [Acinetobacter]|uniref:hypothetical protein n=1 Tax=Acinetobacter TaxID=469 RepID=UPI0002AECF4A|nr:MULTISPECIES: hypothetical protein [Acinetobacter]ELW78174.1 hypothetical protein ACINWC743_3178 [Acinetobacter sp. WC-743]MBJ8428428.1 hypothetical protein [Acinetobacter bereziniae]
MTPSQIEKRIKKLESKYESDFEKLADEIFTKRIIPYCQDKKLSFMMINGFPRLVDQNDEYVQPPKFIINLFDITDSNGQRLLWQLTRDFKFREDVDFNKADHNHHDRIYKNRCLGSLVFSPAFG